MGMPVVVGPGSGVVGGHHGLTVVVRRVVLEGVHHGLTVVVRRVVLEGVHQDVAVVDGLVAAVTGLAVGLVVAAGTG